MVLLTSSLNSFIQLLGVLVIFLFVLLLTYLTSRWVGGFQQAHMHNRNLRIIESIHVANNKYVQIVKAGEVYLVIAVGKDEVTMLAQLTEEQLAELPEQDVPQESFRKNFQELLKKYKEQKRD